MSAPPLRRAGSTRQYKTVSPQLKGFGNTRSCGRCGNFRVPGGGRVRPVYGWCCASCAEK